MEPNAGRSAWLDAGYEILLEAGVEAIKVMTLARRLNVSRTSFYWHFKDRADLLGALVTRWQEKNTNHLIAQANLFAGSLCEAMLNVIDCWHDAKLFDADLDQAIRSWARIDPLLQGQLAVADEQRYEAIKAMFIRHGLGSAQAEVRAMTVLYTQVGYIAMAVKEPLVVRLSRIANYCEVFTGQQPTAVEMQRFYSRHTLLHEQVHE
jgi:AcrR family transcriptional regulator